MQSQMMIAFCSQKQEQWQREHEDRAWLSADARSSRSRKRSPLMRIAFLLFLLGAALVSQIDSAFARPLPTCGNGGPISQTSLRYIRPGMDPPAAPMVDINCGVHPVHPPLGVDASDSQPLWTMLAGLQRELWAVVTDLLPILAQVTALQGIN